MQESATTHTSSSGQAYNTPSTCGQMPNLPCRDRKKSDHRVRALQLEGDWHMGLVKDCGIWRDKEDY
jgi:hypothetical protein